MHIHDLGHYFEFFAGLNLAYAGIDRFRRKVFEILSALFTPESLQPAYKSVSDKTEALKGIFGEDWSQSFVHQTAKIEEDYEKIKESLDAEDEAFLADVETSRPLFLIGFLFCFNNLVVIGFVQFFFEHNTILAEQWLCVSSIFMLIVNGRSFGRLAEWLRHHIGVVASSVFLLVIALSIGACPYEFPGMPYGALATSAIAVIIPLVPLLLDYQAVLKHTNQRNETLSDYIKKARQELESLDSAAEVIQKIHKG